MAERDGFRPDLEGLRGIAVLLVLLYHARVPGFPGGYIGVDVFFVLSGFLITGIIVRELAATGRLDLPAFYARRARRLLPAAALVLVVTMLASAVVLPPLRVPQVAGDTVAAALYVSNIRFAAQATDYLGSTLPPSPVLHYWSLSVEEQFYLFWPTLLVLVTGAAFAAGRREAALRRLTILVGAVFALSLGASIWLTEAAQPWAFFSLPTRTWELALGALLALPLAARVGATRWMGPAGWLGIVLIVVAGVAFDEGTRFPGIAALLPTVGSALVIAAGLRSGVGGRVHGLEGVSVGSVLAVAPLRFLGRISYSLYLWHWPVLVLPAVAVGHALSGPARLGLAVLAIAAAAVSQRWVEEPIRRGQLIGLRTRRSLALGGALSLSVVLVSSSLGAAAVEPAASRPVVGGDISDIALPPDPTWALASPAGAAASPGSRPSLPMATPRPAPPGGPVPADLVPSLATAADDLPAIYADGCHLDVPTTTSPACIFGDAEAASTVVLFGDSHAAQWFPAFLRLAQEHDWRLVSLTKSACPTADLSVWNAIVKRAYTECDAWREDALQRIADERPALVVVADSRGYQPMVGGTAVPVTSARPAWDAAIARTLERLRRIATHVVMIGDTPRATADPATCLSASTNDVTACELAYAKAVDPSWTEGEAEVAAASGVDFIDPTAWVCRTDPCPVVVGRVLVFRDQHHLTATYARALADRLYQRFRADLPDTP